MMNLRARANAHSDECEAFGMRGTASRRERSSVDGSVWWAQHRMRAMRAGKTPSQSRSIASTQILRALRLSHGRDTLRVSSPSTPRSPWSNWATCEWPEYYLCVAAEGVMRRMRARTGFRR
jgi:hypothetical protein